MARAAAKATARPRKTLRRQGGSARRPRAQGKSPLRRSLFALVRILPGVAALTVALLLAGVWAACNWAYHAVRKPTELLAPVSGSLDKSPAETWGEYAPRFREHATSVITPEFLAALAQIESSGNPYARTYWSWHPTWHPFDVYRPASSAVGLYQITDGTFAQTRKECREPPRDGTHDPMYALGPCWLDGLYSRVEPGRAIEMAATMLDRSVTTTLRRLGVAHATLAQKQDLAAVIHLCGAGAGAGFARHGFRTTPDQRCGDHDVRAYVARVNRMKRVFADVQDTR